MATNVDPNIPRHDRLREHTPAHVNQKIDDALRVRLAALRGRGDMALQRRLVELDYEWDIDRTVMVNFAILGGAALLAGSFARRGWHRLLGMQIGFILLHATVGWCPPMALWRRLGVRSSKEIEEERRLILDELAARAGRPQPRAD